MDLEEAEVSNELLALSLSSELLFSKEHVWEAIMWSKLTRESHAQSKAGGKTCAAETRATKICEPSFDGE